MSTIKVNNLESSTGGGVAAKLTSVNGGQLSNRNKVINGAMQVAQRATSVSSVTSGNYYVCDRWKLGYGTAGTWTLSQSTDTPDNFGSSFKFDCTSAQSSLSTGSNLQLIQFFEGQDLQDVQKGTSSAKQITVSFYVKTNKTGTYIVELMDHDNSNRHCSQSYTVSNTNWNRYELTFPADTTGTLDNDNAKSFEVGFWLAAGTNFSSGSLQTSWGALSQTARAAGQVNLADSTSNEWLLTGVQVEVGNIATEFEHRSFGQELALCQRYFQQYSHATYRGFPFSGRKSGSSTVVGTIHGFPPMRAASTGSINNLAGFKIFRFSDGSTTNPTNVAITHEGSVEPFTDLKFTLSVSSFASTGNMCGMFNTNTSGEFTLDAEL